MWYVEIDVEPTEYVGTEQPVQRRREYSCSCNRCDGDSPPRKGHASGHEAAQFDFPRRRGARDSVKLSLKLNTRRLRTDPFSDVWAQGCGVRPSI
jgi:hypothetical protein